MFKVQCVDSLIYVNRRTMKRTYQGRIKGGVGQPISGMGEYCISTGELVGEELCWNKESKMVGYLKCR